MSEEIKNKKGLGDFPFGESYYFTLEDMAQYFNPPSDLSEVNDILDWMAYFNQIWGHVMFRLSEMSDKTEYLDEIETASINDMRKAYVVLHDALKRVTRESKQ